MDPFVQQLATLCRAEVTRSKWVFVPSHALGRTLGERIALSGTNWLNLRFVTPLDIALRMGAPFLVDRSIEPSEEGLGPALIMRLLLELPRSRPPAIGDPHSGHGDGYFRPLADQPTMAQALWTTIRELRMAGVKAGELKPEAFESPAKHIELRGLLEAYERFLAAAGRADMATVYEEALQHSDWCPIQPQDCWTELPATIWSPVQRRLIDAMPGERIVPQALAIPGATVPRRLANVPVERIAAEASTHRLAFLLDPAAGTVTAQRGPASGKQAAGSGKKSPSGKQEAGSGKRETAIHLFHAGGREGEIEEVFRRILAAGASLDQVEIACASDDHVSLVWEKALRHEWGVTLGAGIAASATRPGRALIGLCDWIETDFSAAHLRQLLQSGDIGLEVEDEGFTAGQAARTLARAEAGWGRATYGLALGALRRNYETRAADPDVSDDDRESARTKGQLASAVLGWIEKVIASIPEPGTDGRVDLQPVVRAALLFLDTSTARSSQLDHRAAAALADYVGELEALGAFSCTLEGALRFIRERVLSLQVAQERPRPGHLYACTFAQMGFSGRPHLFVVGLEEGRVFPSATEDPVLLDAEREAISPALRRSADRIDEAVWSVLSRLATASGQRDADSATEREGGSGEQEADTATLREAGSGQREAVTFSYSVRDTREFRETYASWLMLQAYRLKEGNATLSYQDMKAALGEPVSSIPQERGASATEAGWWLRSVMGTGTAGVEAVETAFPEVAQGRVAAAARQSERFTEYDGYVPEAGAVLDPCAGANAFSVTDLEGAAGCPFRLFLKRGLGLRPVDERERDRDVWLDPLTRGSELHDIYAKALRRCREAKRRPDMEKDGAWLQALAEERLKELHREMPAATDEVLARESRDFLADVELFLEAECANDGGKPLAFEVSFGRPLDEDLEVLARAEPVEIDLGSGLRFRIAGRIDRIDEVAPSTFQVLDYKTGGFWRDSWNGTFRGGRLLQHALYGLAAVELLRASCGKPKVVAGVYYFSSHKGQRNRKVIPAPARAAIAAVLADLRELIAAGTFVHAPAEEDCTFCDFKAACGPGVHAQADAKRGDPKLQAFGRLAAHV